MIHRFHAGDTPLLISVPHAGTRLMEGQPERLAVDTLVDTDWHVHQLYAASAEAAGASMLRALYSRWVVDLNRPPDDAPLYTGASTGLVPTETFDGRPLYAEHRAPDDTEIRARIDGYWRPWHDRLEAVLGDLVQRHGHAVLLDAHSIRSRVPRLFEGRLPDLNLGTNDGRSCDPDLAGTVREILDADARFTSVQDGRFKGGYITRHYGRPDQGVHALQLEIAQACYMAEDHPDVFDPGPARPLMERLDVLVRTLAAWRPS